MMSPLQPQHLNVASKVRPLSQYYMQSHAHAERGLLMGFACVNEKDMVMAFGVLLQCLREAGVPTLQINYSLVLKRTKRASQ